MMVKLNDYYRDDNDFHPLRRCKRANRIHCLNIFELKHQIMTVNRSPTSERVRSRFGWLWTISNAPNVHVLSSLISEHSYVSNNARICRLSSAVTASAYSRWTIRWSDPWLIHCFELWADKFKWFKWSPWTERFAHEHARIRLLQLARDTNGLD